MASIERKINGTFAPAPGGYARQINEQTTLFVPECGVARYDPETGELYGFAPAYSLHEAEQVYTRLYDRFVTPAAQNAPAPLTGKYAKLRDDLRAVYKIGLEAAAKVDDGGTCNMDAPALRLTRWNAAKVEQACKEAGGGCFKWDIFNRFVICFPIPGQAHKNETAADDMTKALLQLGYDALTYCAMD